MSESIRAELVLKKERFNGIRLSEFQYTYYCDGKNVNSPLSLVTVDHDMEIVWSITRSFSWTSNNNLYKCQWTSIKIAESDKNFFGTLEIQIENVNPFIAKFDTNSLPFNKKIPLDYCAVGSHIKIIIQVFRELDTSPIDAYGKLLENKNLSDVTFVVGDEEIPANTSILALHSDVFAKMFEVDMSEKKTGQVKITDIEPAILKLLFAFIYSGKVNCEDTEDLLKLSLAANKYELRSLVNLCAYRVSFHLSVENVIDALTTADLVKADFLKKDCADFIIKNNDKIVESESFEQLARSSQSHLFYEIFRRLKAFN